MKTYKQFINESHQLDEAALFGVAIERKLKATLSAVKATNDVGDKIDILTKGLHFSLGSLALNLTKTKRRK
jgi:hypothetical protein